jgi:hypothetical protein
MNDQLTDNEGTGPIAVLARVLRDLREAEKKVSEAIERTNYREAAAAASTAKQKAEEALDAAVAVIERTPKGLINKIPVDLLRAAEDRLGIKIGTFSKFFDNESPRMPSGPNDDPIEVLGAVRDWIHAQTVAEEVRSVPTWLKKAADVVFDIAAAVIVGAFVAAPLSALAVNESIINEITKAGIVLTITLAWDDWHRKRRGLKLATPAPDDPTTSSAPSDPYIPERWEPPAKRASPFISPAELVEEDLGSLQLPEMHVPDLYISTGDLAPEDPSAAIDPDPEAPSAGPGRNKINDFFYEKPSDEPRGNRRDSLDFDY